MSEHSDPRHCSGHASSLGEARALSILVAFVSDKALRATRPEQRADPLSQRTLPLLYESG